MTNEELNWILDAIRKETSVPSLKLTAYRHDLKPWDSKLGGTAYLPLHMTYPTNASGKPLKLLAQLNFSQFPPLKDFPTEGILQFFIATDDVYGVDFDEPTNQDCFRIIYHSDITTDLDALQTPPPIIPEEDFPFEGSFALEGQLTSRMMSPSDWRFDHCFMAHAIRLNPTYASYPSIYDLVEEEQFDLISSYCNSTGHHIGGYPFFTQYDPREQKYQDHQILLLQIDSEGTGKDEIIWGDCGVANFFITTQALATRDFSQVLYTWDCC